jgi:hypothetical protein
MQQTSWVSVSILRQLLYHTCASRYSNGRLLWRCFRGQRCCCCCCCRSGRHNQLRVFHLSPKNSYTPAVVSGGGGGGNGSVAGQQELPSNATLGSGHWVAALEWAIPGPSCVDAITLANYSCTSNASCTNASKGLSGYTCLCDEGYSGDGYKNGSGCTEQEYCNQVPPVCAPNATCTASNTTGYKCACPSGFYGNAYNLSGIGCQDINECNSAMNSCAPNAICTNMPGSYNCSCYSGYSGDGFGNGTGCTAQKSHNQNIPLIAGNQSTTPPLLSKCKLGFFKGGQGNFELLCLLNA